jgi:hypothetical protein
MKKCGLIEDEELSDAHKALIAEKRAALESANGTPSVNKTTTSGNGSDVESYPPGAQMCMKCNTQAMVLLDGCMTCLSCGDSKCG